MDINQAIVSLVIGDGCLYKAKGKGIRLNIKHSPSQYDYLEWKKKFLESYKSVNSVKVYETVTKSANGKTFPQKTMALYQTRLLRPIHEQFYSQDKNKQIKNVIGCIDNPLSLAIWFMDDGGILRYRAKHKDGTHYFRKPPMKLCTQSFSYEENETILKHFENQFGFKGRIYKDKKYFYLYFDKENTIKIWEIIKTYVSQIESMKNKFDLCFHFYS